MSQRKKNKSGQKKKPDIFVLSTRPVYLKNCFVLGQLSQRQLVRCKPYTFTKYPPTHKSQLDSGSESHWVMYAPTEKFKVEFRVRVTLDSAPPTPWKIQDMIQGQSDIGNVPSPLPKNQS